jgi:hypothetical protein
MRAVSSCCFSPRDIVPGSSASRSTVSEAPSWIPGRRLIAKENDTALECSCFQKFQPDRVRHTTEQRLAVSQRDWIDKELILIDQARLRQIIGYDNFSHILLLSGPGAKTHHASTNVVNPPYLPPGAQPAPRVRMRITISTILISLPAIVFMASSPPGASFLPSTSRVQLDLQLQFRTKQGDD